MPSLIERLRMGDVDRRLIQTHPRRPGSEYVVTVEDHAAPDDEVGGVQHYYEYLIYRRPAGTREPFEEVGRSVRRVDGKGKRTYEQIAREDLFS